MKKIITYLNMVIVLIGLQSQIMAQNTKPLKGTVTSLDGTLPGVTIVIKGTTKGAITDSEGKYTIQPNQGDTILFSYIGYLSEEVVYTNQANLDITLIPDIKELESVVVIGYGSVKKRELTGSISVVKGDKLESRQATNVQEVLQGQLAGVQVMSNGGAPGTEATILVRGISTVNNTNPLYIVDGMQMDNIDFLNPKDIESVQVLKDASSAAIYGSKASNGVIVIATKRAKKGQKVLNFDYSSTFEQYGKKPELADAYEYTRIANLAATNSNQTAPYADPDIYGTGTDWWNEIMQPGLANNYSLNLLNGTDDFKVNTGLNYYSHEGILRGGEYNRLNVKLNTEFKMAENVKIGENITIANSQTTNGPNVVWDAQLVEPITNVYRPIYEQTGLNEYSIFAPTTTDVGNPMAQIARSDNTSQEFRSIGNAYIEWEIIKGLTFKSQYNLDYRVYQDNWFSPDYYIEETDKQDVNQVGRKHNIYSDQIWENYLTYNKQINNHNITLLGGITGESVLYKTLFGQGENTPNNSDYLRYLSSTSGNWVSVESGQPSNESSSLLSYFGRMNYAFADKYLLAASIRADGSSVFPEDNRWGIFPAVSAGWVVSEEAFLESQNWISQLKLRSGWGQVGNQFFDDINAKYSTMGLYYTTMGENQEVVIGAAPSTIGNPNLKWETVEDINVGVDVSLFDEKFEYTFDWFQRTSKDNILWSSVPGYMGFGYTKQLTNIGELEAKGFEMDFKYRNSVNDFKYEIGFNLSSVHSKMTKLSIGDMLQDGNHQRLDMLTTTMIGTSAGTFYGFVTDGIFQNQTEINSHSDQNGNLLQPNAEPGDFRFKDINNDGLINDLDKTIIGNPEPDFTYGIYGSISYMNFDLNILFTGSYGNDMLNAIRPYTATGEGYYNSEKGLLEKAWNGEGSTNSQPIIKAVDQNQNFRYSDFYIENGSYLRLKNIQLAYTLPSKISEKIKMTNAKIFVSGENLLTVTNFSGLDPDIGGSPTLRGVDWGHYPSPKRISIGVNVSF